MYKKNFVCAVKTGDKILRESDDRVELPFGSEYSVLLKNLDSVRMQARISIDGKQATGWLVIDSGRDVEIERFVENLDRGNRFKFIERTEQIENHRGIKPEDGLIRVEFKREKIYEAPKVVEHHTYHKYYHHYDYTWPHVYPYSYNGPISNSNFCGSLTRSSASGSIQSSQNVQCFLNNTNSTPSGFTINETGITVPGSISEQKFIEVAGFDTDKSEVIVLHLVGVKQTGPVKVAKTVKVKISCQTCGNKSKSSAKFCKQCGTSLETV